MLPSRQDGNFFRVGRVGGKLDGYLGSRAVQGISGGSGAGAIQESACFYAVSRGGRLAELGRVVEDHDWLGYAS